MRRLALLLLLAGCSGGGEQERNRTDNKQAGNASAPAVTPPTEEEQAASQAAAAALRDYYQSLARRDYRAAWALRDRRPGLDFERFAASFEGYEEYRATVGLPSMPVEQEGTLWVSVPVQLYGRMRGGAPFGSAGRVTMKRAPGEAWKIVS